MLPVRDGDVEAPLSKGKDQGAWRPAEGFPETQRGASGEEHWFPSLAEMAPTSLEGLKLILKPNVTKISKTVTGVGKP